MHGEKEGCAKAVIGQIARNHVGQRFPRSRLETTSLQSEAEHVEDVVFVVREVEETRWRSWS